MEISSITFFPRHTRVTVRFRHHLYSSQVPGLQNVLLTMLPSLREHLCTNRNGLSFVEELEDTELGHVFEHVMLALLHKRGLFIRGQTTWNWQRDRIGTYHVTINTGKKLLVKESLVIAQAIFTNALLGPVLHCNIEGLGQRTKQSWLNLHLRPSARAKPQKLSFAGDKELPVRK